MRGHRASETQADMELAAPNFLLSADRKTR
jgi:hypothetical protein